MKTKILLTALSCSLLSIPLLGCSGKAKWNYDANSSHGPSHWGDFYPDCKAGGLQSPTNIVSSEVSNKPAAPLSIHFQELNESHYDNSHAIEMDSKVPLKGFIDYDHKEYSLLQYHFHSPSENKLNGKQFAVEEHFVTQDEDGNYLVAAVFIKPGQKNTSVQIVLDHLGEKTKEHSLSKEALENLFPSNRTYYSFEGSFTTPGCNRNIKWAVFSDPITASPKQIAHLMKIHNGNFRPQQAINGRQIDLGLANFS